MLNSPSPVPSARRPPTAASLPFSEPLRDGAQTVALFHQLMAHQAPDYGQRAAEAVALTQHLLAQLGSPERQLRIAHLAGSKGKSSTALALERLLLAQGVKVGTFTSPHLQRWGERFRLDGVAVEEAALVEVVEALRGTILSYYRQRGHGPGFFAVLTAAALGLFQRSGVDLVVLETGLGGRRDPTNAVTPIAAAITSIEREHSAQLGGDIAAIAAEKAGIIKPDIPVIVGELPAAAAAVIHTTARTQRAPLYRLGSEYRWRYRSEGLTSHVSVAAAGEAVTVALPLAGRHLAHNIALALSLGHHCGLDWHQLDKLQQAAAELSLPGRSELLHRSPWVVIDSAHTLQSARALAEVLALLVADPSRQRRQLVVSLARDKSPGEILAPLLPLFTQVTFTCALPERCWQAADLAREAPTEGLTVAITADPQHALTEAMVRLQRDDLLCITGSNYLAGRGRQTWLNGLSDGTFIVGKG